MLSENLLKEKPEYKTDLKVYRIGFNGTDNFRNVTAKNVKEAKCFFAHFHGILLSDYVVAKKHDVQSLNDQRISISAWYAEHPNDHTLRSLETGRPLP